MENKQLMLASLQKQIELEKITYSLLKVQAQLGRCSGEEAVELALHKLAEEHSLEYRSDRFLAAEKQYLAVKARFRKDKEFLASVMTSLQQPHRTRGVGGAALLKQYNNDVRAMRQNEDRLLEMEATLRLA